MSLDLRIPMGLMFTLVGLILTLFGWATNGNEELYARCLGINTNLWWGMVLLVFGFTMLTLGRRSQKRLAALPPEPLAEEDVQHKHRSIYAYELRFYPQIEMVCLQQISTAACARSAV